MKEDILLKYYIHLKDYELLVTNLVKATIQRICSSGVSIYLEGLDNRIKNYNSFICKCNRKDNLYPAIFYVYDILRYTIILPVESFYMDYKLVINSFKDEGLEIYRIKNTWLKFDRDIPYRGINIVFGYRDGVLLEIQIHTYESYQMNLKTHELYMQLLSCTNNKVIKTIKLTLEQYVNVLKFPNNFDCIAEYNNEKKMLNDILKYIMKFEK